MKILFIPTVKNAFFQRLSGELINLNLCLQTRSDLFWDPSNPFDIVHIHFPEAFYLWENQDSSAKQKQSADSFIKTLEVWKRKNTKIIWTVHNLNGHDSNNPELDQYVYATFIDLCDGIIYQSKRAIQLVQDVYKKATDKKNTIIAHANYMGCYPNDISRSMARRHLNIKNDCSVFLFVGQIRPYKNIPFLIRAFKQLQNKNSNLHLIIAGKFHKTFPFVERITVHINRIINRHILLDERRIPDDELQIYLNAADVAVFPYKNIFMSGAVILAQSFGCPVIVPDCGCLPDYVVNDVTGFLFNHNDLTSLSQTMEKALQSNLPEIGKNAANFQLQNNPTKVASLHKQFYKQIFCG